MRRRRVSLVAWVVLAAIVLLALGPRIRVAYLTTLLLLELPTPETDGPIASRLPDPQVTRVTFEAGGRTMIADVYLPAAGSQGSCHPGIVLNHGVAAGGMNDLRLTNFADALARCGFVALVPEFIHLKELRVRASDVDEMVGSYEYLEQLPSVDAERTGFFGFSYAGGLAVLAANDSRISERVRFCFLLGSYYDIRSIVIYATTGYYLEDGEWVYMKPRHTGKWAFLKNMLELVDDDGDRVLLGRIADAKLAGDERDISAAADSLREDGADLYELMMSDDPDAAGRIIERLNPRILSFFDELSMQGNIDSVRAHLIITHGRDDNLMPYTESIRLADNAPPEAAVQLRILESFQHVDLEFGWEGGPAGWVATLAEVGKVYSVVYALLEQGLL